MPRNVPDNAIFLQGPAEIRKEIERLTAAPALLKFAVAFVREQWRSLLSCYQGSVRLICWLNTTNTNPYEVEAMMALPNFEVRQLDSMHANVYLAPGAAAVVGSANLSATVLDDSGTSGQHEAAVLLTDSSTVQQIGRWFDAMWSRSRKIEKQHLDDAKKSYDLARTKLKSVDPAGVPLEREVQEAGASPSVQTTGRSVVGSSEEVAYEGPVPYQKGSMVRAVFLAAARRGGATARELRAKKGSSDVAIFPVSKHVRDGSRGRKVGRNNYVWAIQINGGRPILNYSVAEFNRLPDSARVAIVHVVHKSDVPILRSWAENWRQAD